MGVGVHFEFIESKTSWRCFEIGQPCCGKTWGDGAARETRNWLDSDALCVQGLEPLMHPSGRSFISDTDIMAPRKL